MALCDADCGERCETSLMQLKQNSTSSECGPVSWMQPNPDGTCAFKDVDLPGCCVTGAVTGFAGGLKAEHGPPRVEISMRVPLLAVQGMASQTSPGMFELASAEPFSGIQASQAWSICVFVSDFGDWWLLQSLSMMFETTKCGF